MHLGLHPFGSFVFIMDCDQILHCERTTRWTRKCFSSWRRSVFINVYLPGMSVQHAPASVRILRIVCLLLITLSMFSSIGIIGFSVRFLVELGYIGPLIGTYSPFIIPFVTTLAGIVTFVMTPVGLFSMITGRRTMMLAYCIVVAFIISLCFYSALLSHSLKQEIETGDMESWMTISLKEEYGHPHGQYITDAWDKLQKDLKCCGASRSNGSEWQAAMWFKTQMYHPRPRLPLSCCTTCEDIHEQYCYALGAEIQSEFENSGDLSLSHSPGEDQRLQEDKRICIRASALCTSADTVVANEGVCVGYSVPPRGLPRGVFQHDGGCYSKLMDRLHPYMSRFISMNALYSVILLFCCMTWMALSLLSAKNDYFTVDS